MDFCHCAQIIFKKLTSFHLSDDQILEGIPLMLWKSETEEKKPPLLLPFHCWPETMKLEEHILVRIAIKTNLQTWPMFERWQQAASSQQRKLAIFSLFFEVVAQQCVKHTKHSVKHGCNTEVHPGLGQEMGCFHPLPCWLTARRQLRPRRRPTACCNNKCLQPQSSCTTAGSKELL